ncbi:MAG TPA: glycosyltransferase [Candidatus Onthovicinus excrementipullorum]|nr:glycosyltransferase [Candidatus Onthovicinus excrementipullorum]
MTIVIVIDTLALNNGTTMTAYRFANMLRAHGHTVRFVSTGPQEEGKFVVRERYFPLATPIARKQGIIFARSDRRVFRQAFEGADVVHLMMPFPFEHNAMRVAREMGIPCSTAFHVQPENITYITHTDALPRMNESVYRLLYRMFYKDFHHIHCPSKFIAGQLEKNGYDAKLYVISNGVDAAFRPAEKKDTMHDDLFRILMIGRLSPEKRQNILIKAVSLSRHRDRIQLYLAGKGPRAEALRNMGKTLPHPPVIGFYSQEELIRLIHSCDLYVHASVVEIEAISCMESFACGLVPVICDAPQSATRQFALDERSLFKPDDPRDLAAKIDYWIEHPEERQKMSVQYAREGDEYRVERSVEKAEQMFREVIEDYRNGIL